MSWKPDEVRRLPDGSREEVRWRRSPGADGGRSRMRKIIAPDGTTRKLWHEVFDVDGNIIHQHQK